MKRTDYGVIWGVLLIVAGILFLLQTFNVLGAASTPVDTIWGIVWALVFAATGLTFLRRFFADITGSWWATIPGFTMTALAVLVALGTMGFGKTENEGVWLGAFFLAAIGLSFWVIYAVRREMWWAIIPGGVMLTTAAVALASQWFPEDQQTGLGAILFFGLAATFGLVSLVPTEQGHLAWALIPASIMAIMGVAVLMSSATAVNYIWPVVLILVGIYLLFRRWGGGEITRHG